jgi:hypothetical protein
MERTLEELRKIFERSIGTAERRRKFAAEGQALEKLKERRGVVK